MTNRQDLPLKRNSLKRDSLDSLSDQIYMMFRNAVHKGILQPGSKLPSTRDIAERLGVSRPTVFVSIERLSAEGYVEVRPGSGIYVGEHAKFESSDPLALVAPFSRYGKLLQAQAQKHAGLDMEEPEIAFYPWRPAFDQFPKTEWARFLGRQARTLDDAAMDHAKEAQGSKNLRKQISRFVNRYRGIDCSAEQVVLTMGLNDAIDLFGRLHLDASSQVLVEDPGYHLARQILALSGAVVRPGSLDSEGICIPQTRTKIDLLYVTPSHQFPTGVTMSLKRRIELLQWASKNNTVIAEDDYDSEYQVSGKPIPALMSLVKNEVVLYAGTFNQLMFPGLSLGYVIVPPQLAQTYILAKRLGGEPLPLQVQNAICEFLEQGELERHMRRLQGVYCERRLTLTDELKKAFGKKVELKGQDAGVFVLARFNTSTSEEEIQKRASWQKLGLISTRVFYQNQKNWDRGEYILGFGNLSPEKIREGVRRLKAVFA